MGDGACWGVLVVVVLDRARLSRLLGRVPPQSQLIVYPYFRFLVCLEVPLPGCHVLGRLGQPVPKQPLWRARSRRYQKINGLASFEGSGKARIGAEVGAVFKVWNAIWSI